MTRHPVLPRVVALACRAAVGLAALSAAGCTTTSFVLGMAGVATDTSVSWEIAKHLHAKMTEGDPAMCFRLNSVERALAPRCGSFAKGSLRAADLARNDVQGCPLTLAARDPQLWPVLPELLDKGAQPESCEVPPLVALAAREPCPDFSKASPEVRRSIEFLAQADVRSIHHDVVRMLSCPSSRAVGFDQVLDAWLAGGALQRESVGFGVLGALHPDYLSSPFAHKLETQGHTAQASLGAFQGQGTSGFEEALRLGHEDALQWWLNRAPQLANRVPPTRGNQVPWAPLARVLQPGFMAEPARQTAMLDFLMARGADPWKPVPGGQFQSVVSYARFVQSPLAQRLDPPARPDEPTTPKRMLANAAGVIPVNEVASTQGH